MAAKLDIQGTGRVYKFVVTHCAIHLWYSAGPKFSSFCQVDVKLMSSRTARLMTNMSTLQENKLLPTAIVTNSYFERTKPAPVSFSPWVPHYRGKKKVSENSTNTHRRFHAVAAVCKQNLSPTSTSLSSAFNQNLLYAILSEASRQKMPRKKCTTSSTITTE